MIKRYRYRAYPTPEQESFLARSFGCARVVFNDVIHIRKAAHRDGEKVPSFSELSRNMAQAKKTPERSWLAEVSATVLQQSMRDADTAYRNFFTSLKGTRKGRKVQAPRFKSRHDAQQSIRITGKQNFGVRKVNRHKSMLRLPKMGEVRLNLSRPLPTAPSSVTIIREADGRYYASFVVDAPVRPAPEPVHQAAGMDLGLTDLAIIAYPDGTHEKIENPRHLRKQQRKLATAQKELARRQKGSANREKTRKKVAVLHRKVRETRMDHHHKLARKLVDENQIIGAETLGITGMARTRLAKSIHDAGWGILMRLIEEKAIEAGRVVVRAPRDFPSTRLCSACGVIGEKKPLDVRAWVCECGVAHDRDVNAAVNLLHVAAGHAETLNAGGGNVSPGFALATPVEAGTTQPTAA